MWTSESAVRKGAQRRIHRAKSERERDGAHGEPRERERPARGTSDGTNGEQSSEGGRALSGKE